MKRIGRLQSTLLASHASAAVTSLWAVSVFGCVGSPSGQNAAKSARDRRREKEARDGVPLALDRHDDRRAGHQPGEHHEQRTQVAPSPWGYFSWSGGSDRIALPPNRGKWYRPVSPAKCRNRGQTGLEPLTIEQQAAQTVRTIADSHSMM